MFLKLASNWLATGHPWPMSLAAVAIVVSSVSAAFTGTNMTLSFLTYRRVRPRVRVAAEWGNVGVGDHGTLPRMQDGTLRSGLRVHVSSQSPTDAKVKSVHVTRRHPFKGGVIRGTHSRISDSPAQFVEKEQEMELPGYGGLDWEIEDPRCGFPAWQFTGFRVRVILTNGDQARSKWVSGRKAREADYWDRYAIEEYHKLNPGHTKKPETEESAD